MTIVASIDRFESDREYFCTAICSRVMLVRYEIAASGTCGKSKADDIFSDQREQFPNSESDARCIAQVDRGTRPIRFPVPLWLAAIAGIKVADGENSITHYQGMREVMVQGLSDITAGSLIVAGVLAFLIAVACAVHWGHDRSRGLVPYLFYPVLAVVSFGVLFSGRNLNFPSDVSWLTAPKSFSLAWATRIVSAFVVFSSIERILRRVFLVGAVTSFPALLMVAMLFFYVTNVVSPVLFGFKSVLSHDYLYVVIAACAALLVLPSEQDAIVCSARNALMGFVVLSGITTAWHPELTTLRHYRGVIPGFDIRYAGLAVHPNGVGPLVVALMLCLWVKPYRQRLFNLVSWGLALSSLVFAQSKTSWGAFVVCAICVLYFDQRDGAKRRLFDYSNPALPALLSVALMLSALALWIALTIGGLAEDVSNYFEFGEGAKMLTFMGRNEIWDAALAEWMNHPIFGYGLDIWDDSYRAAIGIPAAVSAHDQFLQSLSSAGIMGALGFVCYGLTLLALAVKTGRASRGLSLGLFSLIALESVSETPLDMTELGASQLLHLLLLMVIAAYMPQAVGDQRSFQRAAGADRHVQTST